MEIYDISMEIKEDMAIYKNKEEKKPRITRTRISQGANETKLEIDSHTGTHIDAYFHMLANGKTIDKISLNKFIGNCVVLDFSNKRDKITVKDINNKILEQNFKIEKNDIVLLKTRKEPLKKFNYNFTYLEKSGAKFLANRKVKCVGIDNLSIERNQLEHETHKVLFKNSIPIVEGLDLSKISQGRYFFIGLPLKIKGGDGSPIRAVLVNIHFLKNM